ncbi:type II toxin-antitoxin system RelE/ParE family toxin [Polynucleobacter sp. Latsch14-2]|jgi:mRNA interferase RelE/StbE|uniref:type II toxin-antitoxin system RelE family toxin n=1 Tax=Polynucleobacter sp. Latsch14-2 TaxID=2576920 RepID=UPI001C0D3FE6|nr:type II toxin-antitoxin system RelE/ParE family toxin [Polynucleobacter sp. Latsch14-2]MBU3614816.1 type II toxin-antitoxin system RelE/ParE family toxin [Polynucleobacter sp. Latsch14-2]
MSYKLEFYEDAYKEWNKLDATVREQFRIKLIERLENPCVPSAKLRRSDNRYKIKLRQVGYRLVYEVINKTVTVTVIAIGKRDRDEVYKAAAKRTL